MATTPPVMDNTKAVILAGLLGSAVSLCFVDDMSPKQRIVAILVGTVMAHYVAPFICHIYGAENYQETVGFLIGLFGMSITAAVFRAIRSSDLWNLIMRRWGGNGQQQEGGE